MGRLLRKKNIDKKKKRQANLKANAEQVGNEAGKTSGFAVDATKKKTITPVKKKSAATGKGETSKPNIIQNSIQFLREVKAELKKVTWPSRKQTTSSTVVVIIMVMFIAFYLGTVDFGLSNLIRVVLQ